MKKCKLILTITLLFFSFASSAQIWKNAEKKIGKKIEQKASDRAERKIDKAIDKSLDKIEEAPSGNQPSEQPSEENQKAPAPAQTPSASVPGIGIANVNLPEKYTFKIGVTYETKEDASKNKKPQIITTWYGDEQYMGMEADKSNFVVLDAKRSAMITFMEEAKMYLAISSDFTNVQTKEKNEVKEKAPSVEKIGSEKVLGYDCTIYQITTEDGVTKVWYTRDLKVGYSNFMAAMAQSSKKQKEKYMVNDIAEGVMMKMESQEKGSNKVMTMIATSINKNGLSFSTSDYKPMSY